MSSDSVSVSGPVEVESISREAVAFKLMNHISNWEDTNNKNSRRYWLGLYRQCYKATSGASLESILKEE